jgi:spore germination protein GerM
MDTCLRRMTVGALLAVSALLAGCIAPAATSSPQPIPTGSTTPVPSSVTPTPTPPVSPTPTNTALTEVTVYFVAADEDGPGYLVPVVRQIAPWDDPLTAALTALLEGPTSDERQGIDTGRRGFQPLTTAIPVGTALRGILHTSGRGVVPDLSAVFVGEAPDPVDLAMREAQLVYTIFAIPDRPGIDGEPVAGVGIMIDGQPMDVIEGHEGSVVPGGRLAPRHFFDQLPPIFVEQPAWGASRTSTLEVSGRAQLLTDTFYVGISDGDMQNVVVRAVTAPTGDGWMPPGGGAFRLTLAVPESGASDVRLRAWTADGFRISNLIEIPLR